MLQQLYFSIYVYKCMLYSNTHDIIHNLEKQQFAQIPSIMSPKD